MSQRRGSGILLAIALFKLLKSAALITVGVAALRLAHDNDAFDTLRRLVSELRIDPDNLRVNRAINAISGLDERRLRELGVGTFIYAAVFLVEGTGLLLRKRWAEYLTIAVTGSFVPFEVYELIHKPSAVKLAGLTINVLIVVYLVLRRWHERQERANTPHSHGVA